MMFRVMWKMPRMKAVTGNYDCPDYKTLLRILEKSENVTPANVEAMYVHHISTKTGQTIELLAVEKDSNVVKLNTKKIEEELNDDIPFGSEQAEVIAGVKTALTAIKDKPSNKPRFKLSQDNKPTVVGGFYNVYKAPSSCQT